MLREDRGVAAGKGDGPAWPLFRPQASASGASLQDRKMPAHRDDRRLDLAHEVHDHQGRGQSWRVRHGGSCARQDGGQSVRLTLGSFCHFLIPATVAGVRVSSLHQDMRTATGEELMLFALANLPVFRLIKKG